MDTQYMREEGEDVEAVAIEQPTRNLGYKVTIEPQMFAIFFSLRFAEGVITLLLLNRACEVTLGLSHENCSILGQDTPEAQELEEKVQKTTVQFLMILSILQSLMPAVELFFVGPWSDSNGRKPVIVVSMIGFTLMYFLYSVVSSISNLNPNFIILSPIPICLLGGYVNIYSSVYCYVSEICAPEDRSFRIGIVEMVVSVSGAAGFFSSAPLFDFFNGYGHGYLGVFSICTLLCFGSLIHAIFCLSETVIRKNNQRTTRNCSAILTYPREMFQTCMKKRDGRRRSVLLLCVASMALWVFAFVGPLPIDLLFVRKQFTWNYSNFTILDGANICFTVAGIIITTRVLTKYLKVPEIAVAMLASAMGVARYIIFAFAASNQSYLLYVAISFNVISGGFGPVVRAIMSKLVPKTDLGKVISFSSSLEAVSNIVAPLLYSSVYRESIEFLPGMPYLISGVVNSIVLTLLLTASLISKRADSSMGYMYHVATD